MTRPVNLIRRFIADENGATLLEYTVLLGIMLIAVITTIMAVGNWVTTQWTGLNTNLGTVP